MEPGDSVLVLRWAANYDEREFDEPLTVRLDRRPNRHGSFGLGPHRCAGSHFARAVLQVMVGRVLTRIPHYVVDEDRVADRRRDRFGIPSAVHCVYPVS